MEYVVRDVEGNWLLNIANGFAKWTRTPNAAMVLSEAKTAEDLASMFEAEVEEVK